MPGRCSISHTIGTILRTITLPTSRRTRNAFGVASFNGVLRSVNVFQLKKARTMATKLPTVAKMKRPE